MIVGIDPGKTGGMAVLNPEGIASVKSPPLVGDELDFVAWAKEWNVVLPFASHIWVEQVGAMPGQGVTSMFNFGKVFGFVMGLAFSAGVPVSFVRPQEWKKAVGIPAKSDKSASRIRASQLFPNEAHFWKLAKHDGLAESALIAYYGSTRKGT